MADEELEPELEPIMQAHLDACPPCRGWADELVAIVRHLRGAARGTKAAASR
jgi:predicted anti-sigma-YlaC factor YlaD